MTESGLLDVMGVFIVGSSVVIVPLTLRAGRPWNAASQAVIAIFIATVFWGKPDQLGKTFFTVVIIGLMIAVLVCSVMSLREIRGEIARTR